MTDGNVVQTGGVRIPLEKADCDPLGISSSMADVAIEDLLDSVQITADIRVPADGGMGSERTRIRTSFLMKPAAARQLAAALVAVADGIEKPEPASPAEER